MSLDRSHFIHFPFVDPVSWAKRYGIEPASADCYRCGTELHTCIPFAHGQLRGLIAPLCSCGHPNPPYCVVMSNGGSMVDYLLGK